MARQTTLDARFDPTRNRWILNIPANFSETGKRSRESFPSKKEADDRANHLRRRRSSKTRALQTASPELVYDAIQYDALFRDLYGFSGLAEACKELCRRIDSETVAVRFGELLDRYERENSANWQRAYSTFWKWFRQHLSSEEPKPLTALNTNYWSDWLNQLAQKQKWKDRTFNDVASTLSSVWKFAVARDLATRNPLNGIARRKIRRCHKAVYTPEQVRAIMNCAWNHDRDLVPFFAIAIFAGLRPGDRDSEIMNLTWDDVNFDERWIRVATNYDNKTATKRFVPMEENLLAWLAPWRDATGPVIPPNFVKRRRYIVRGKYQSQPDAQPSQWQELAPFGSEVRDITRHTYGSYLEAKYRDRNIVKENMGHSDFTTYEQHYRNARTPQEAREFWSIVPPTEREENT